MEDANAKYAIHQACRDGHTQKVESLLSTNPKLSLLVDPDTRLPLHWAVSHAHLPIVTLLLAHKPAPDIDTPDSSGWTPLMIAASHPDGEPLVSLLLSRSADPNAVTNAGQTALHFASSKANIDVVRHLLDAKASARVKDRRGQLALHRAAAVGSVPVLKELLGRGRSPVNAADVDGMTALHHAVCEGRGDAALFLLTSGAEWDRMDADGRTPLECAPDAKTRKFVLEAAEREGIELE